SPTHTGQLLTPIPAPDAENGAGGTNKTAVIVGSIFAVAVIAFAVGYAIMRRNMAHGGSGGYGYGRGRGGGIPRRRKKIDQEDVKYIRPITPAAMPQVPAAAAMSMTMRHLDDNGETQTSRYKRASPPLPRPLESTRATRAAMTATTRSNTAPMLARGRSAQ
ncbi:hypothetical protein BGZ95_006267, partial [Linnemannia exigua]